MPQRWNSCFKINYNMLLISLRKTGLVQLFTFQLFEPPFLNQEVAIHVAPGLEQGIYPPHSFSSLGCRTSLLGLNITHWMWNGDDLEYYRHPSCFCSFFRFEWRFDGLRLSNIVSKTYQALMIFEKKLSSVMNLNTNKL